MEDVEDEEDMTEGTRKASHLFAVWVISLFSLIHFQLACRLYSVTVRALACDLQEVASSIVSILGQVVHTQVSLVTKQCNLVPVAGQRCPATGKVTVSMASY